MDITAAIRHYLESNGIKQTFLSKKCGWTRQNTNRILHKGGKITADEYAAICEALGLPYDRFYNEVRQNSA